MNSYRSPDHPCDLRLPFEDTSECLPWVFYFRVHSMGWGVHRAMDTWLPTQKPSKSLFWTILWVWLDSLIKLRRAHSEKKFRPSPSVLSSLLRSCLLKDSVNPSRFKRWLMSRCLWGSRTQMCAAVPTFACPRPLMLLDRVWWLGKASFYSPKNV